MRTPEQAEIGDTDSFAEKRRVTMRKAQRFLQVFFSEFFATALLMFVVCVGCMDLGGGPVSPLQTPIAAGFAIAALIASFGHISGCMMNPALAACLFSLRQIDFAAFVVYVIGEVVGAIAGFGLLKSLVPMSVLEANPNHCETHPHPEMSSIGAAVFEFFITTVLIFFICAAFDPRNASRLDSAPIKFGFAVTALAFAGGSFTGASMNPARSFAPALWNNSWSSSHWVYWVGPLASGFLIPLLYRFLFEKDLTKDE